LLSSTLLAILDTFISLTRGALKVISFNLVALKATLLA
jgi:hypothetical protein